MDQILVVKKEAGMTSRDVVNQVGKIFQTKKIGHTGTLDPLATGVLVLCIGKYTKLVEELTSYTKEYIAEIMLGIDTDTLDTTGNISRDQKAIYSQEEIEQALVKFPRIYDQEVPIYSAVKIRGKKLYEYARAGEKVDLPKRKVQIFNLTIENNVSCQDSKTIFSIQCKVSKGTYIRSLIRDIAKSLNTVGVMSKLTRIKQGEFTIEEAYTLEQIRNGQFQFASVEKVFSEYEKRILTDEEMIKVRNGMFLLNKNQAEKVLLVDQESQPIALYKKHGNDQIRPYKMLI